MTEKGLELIKKFEGCRLAAYQCPAGVWTIGYGHTAGVKKGMRISQEEADKMLADDVAVFEKRVRDLVIAPLNPYQMDALVSFAYNCGLAAFEKSTLRKRVNNQEPTEAICAEFGKWVHSGKMRLEGLVRRRAAEAELFKTTYYDVQHKCEMK